MKKIKTFICAVLALALTLSATSCITIVLPGGSIEDPASSASEIKSDDASSDTEAYSSESQTSSEDEIFAKYSTELTAAALDCDEIQFYPTEDGHTYFIVRKGEKYGSMTESGEEIQKPAGYDLHYDFKNGKREIVAATSKDYSEVAYVVGKDGRFKKEEVWGWGIEEGADVCWYDGAPIIFDWGSGVLPYSADTVKGYSRVIGALCNTEFFIEPAVLPVQEISGYTVDGDEYYATVDYKLKSEKYGLLDVGTGKMLTGFEFDGVYPAAAAENGYFAVKKDGKWGYATQKGEMITKFEFDAPKTEKFEYEGVEPTVFELLYMPVNGFIVTYKDGGCGLIDTSGDTVLENEYEFISQVNPSGVCWVKENGAWSQCKISKN